MTDASFSLYRFSISIGDGIGLDYLDRLASIIFLFFISPLNLFYVAMIKFMRFANQGTCNFAGLPCVDVIKTSMCPLYVRRHG
jgi:hypothetical protein